jgi:predicted N-formylglutamate amidohydrolase
MSKLLNKSDKVTLMAISLEFARLIAQLSCRVSNNTPFIEDEEENTQANCVNLQAVMALILDVQPDELAEAFKLTRSGQQIAELMTQIQATA